MSVWYLCASVCAHELGHTIQLYDDYNEPIGTRITQANHRHLKPDENNQPNEDQAEDDEEDEEEDEEDEPNESHSPDNQWNDATSERNSDQVVDDGQRVANTWPQVRSTAHRSSGPIRTDTHNHHNTAPVTPSAQVQSPLSAKSDLRSLLVKVYRGPTKEIDQKPFASWGYFVKYPSEDNLPPSKGSNP